MEYKDPEYKPPEEQFKDLFKNEDKENIVKVSCPSCGSTTPAANINLERLLAKCDACDSVFSVEEKLSPLDKMVKSKDEIHHIPDGIEFAEFRDGIDFRAKLKTAEPPLTMLFIFAFLLASLMVFGYMLGVDANIPLMGLIFLGTLGLGNITGIIHYWMIWKNGVHISVDDFQLKVDYPGLKKNFSIPTNQVEKIYLREAGITVGFDGERRMTHDVRMKKNDDDLDKTLLKQIIPEKQAKFIVQEINRYLEKEQGQN